MSSFQVDKNGSRREVLFNCDICEKPIFVGNTYCSINKNLEKGVSTPIRIEIEVVDSQEVVTLCEECEKKHSNKVEAAITHEINQAKEEG